jgi:hypothetical protein
MQHTAIPLRSINSSYTVNVNEILKVVMLRRKTIKKKATVNIVAGVSVPMAAP